MNNPNQKEDFEGREAGIDLTAFRRALTLVASGLTLVEGQARLDREARRKADQLAAKKRAKLDRARVRALRDGEDATWSKGELKALAGADEVEARAALIQPVKGRPATKARTEAAAIRLLIKSDAAIRAEARRADLRLNQSIELDAEREGWNVEKSGPVLEAKRGQATKRLRTRDGLVMLTESGALTAYQLAVGLRYRDRYEIAQTTLGSCLGGSDKAKTTPTLWTQCRAAQRRASRANAVRVLEAAVSTRLHPDALIALRMIAGEARTLRSITPARRRQIRLTEGLGHALDIVGDMLAKGH